MDGNKQYRRIKDQFSIKDVGSTLLNQLAKGLYPAHEVLREYIQNAIDAHRLWRHHYHSEPEGPIQVEVRGDQLSILDYGIGMFEDEVRRVKSIAVTTKVDADVPLTGHKGVGIWAGLSYFETLVLETTRRSSKKGYRLTLYFKQIVDSINDRADIGEVMENNYFIDEYDEDSKEHYTSITLERPKNSTDWFTEASKVRDTIRRICPCEIDPNFVFYDKVMDWYNQHNIETYPIVVEGTPVYHFFPSSVENFKTSSISVNDEEVAVYWQAVSKKHKLKPTNDELIGFRLIESGFALGGINPYSDTHLQDFKSLNVSISNYLEWYVGEIHITSDNLRPNLDRKQLEESEEARQFIRRLRNFYEKIEEQGRELSNKRKIEDMYKDYEMRINSLIERDLLVNFNQQDIATLNDIRDALTRDERLAASGTDAKKNASLRDSNVKKLRSRLMTKVESLLTNAIGSIRHKPPTDNKDLVNRSPSKEPPDSTRASLSAWPREPESKLGIDATIDLDHTTYSPENTLPNQSAQLSKGVTLDFDKKEPYPTPDNFMPISTTVHPKEEPSEVEETEQNLEGNIAFIVSPPVQFDNEIIEINEIEFEETDQEDEAEQEKVFDTSSHKIPIAIVLGLLEEILDGELGKASDAKSLIMTKLKEQIKQVLSNV